MFENFSFDTPRSPSVDSNNTTSTNPSRSVSPCSATSPYSAEYTITDLAADFNRQRLRQDSQIYSQPCESYANLEDDAGWSVEPDYTTEVQYASRVRSGSVQSFSMSRRRDRIMNARLLCSGAHHKEISTLVTRMIESGEQCSICPSTTALCLLQPDEEDDLDEIDGLTSLSRQSSALSFTRSKDFRRMSDYRRTGASVCKDIRLRKDKPRRQKSSDSK